MQNAELFRRGVVVPLDDTAAKALEAQDVDETTPVHFVPIKSQPDFEVLWDTGFFASLNEKLGSMLDDYEEEAIPVAMVSQLRKVAAEYLRRSAGDAIGNDFFRALDAACDVAQRAGQPVYFIL